MKKATLCCLFASVCLSFSPVMFETGWAGSDSGSGTRPKHVRKGISQVERSGRVKPSPDRTEYLKIEAVDDNVVTIRGNKFDIQDVDFLNPDGTPAGREKLVPEMIVELVIRGNVLEVVVPLGFRLE